MRYVALDFETANASPISACSVGLSVFEDTKLLHSDVYLIQPPEQFCTFHWFNIKVHGITRAMVADAPTFAELWPSIQDEIEDAVVVCHNAVFDTAVLCKTLAFYRIPSPHCRYVCTVKVSQKVWPELENHRLDTVSAALQIPLNHHEAGSDALACGLILQKALETLDCTDADVLAEKIDMRLGVIAPEGNISCSTAQEIARARERAAQQAIKKRRYPPRGSMSS